MNLHEIFGWKITTRSKLNPTGILHLGKLFFSATICGVYYF